MNKGHWRPWGLVVLAVAALATSGAALADRGGHGHSHGGSRVGIGIQFGPGYGYPGYAVPYYGPAYPYYGSPYYYGSPIVVTPAAPPQYIERGDLADDDDGSPSGYWYRCDKPEGYYPYVQTCPGGWQQVPAQPASNAR